jgi:hypothetical protein
MSARRVTDNIARVKGHDSNDVEASYEYANVYRVWLYLNGEPDDEWIRCFVEAAQAADIRMGYEQRHGQPAVAFESEELNLNDVVLYAERLIDAANARRRDVAEHDRQEAERKAERDADARRVSANIDGIA